MAFCTCRHHKTYKTDKPNRPGRLLGRMSPNDYRPGTRVSGQFLDVRARPVLCECVGGTTVGAFDKVGGWLGQQRFSARWGGVLPSDLLPVDDGTAYDSSSAETNIPFPLLGNWFWRCSRSNSLCGSRCIRTRCGRRWLVLSWILLHLL